MRNKKTFTFRRPEKSDGERVWRLIAECPPLDQNSLYCNLLQCTHFAETCVAAECDGELVGWVSGYCPPEEPDSVFVWQVAVHESARGAGLGRRMLETLINSDGAKKATKLKTTITKANDASWALFRSFAKSLDAAISDEEWLNRETEFGGRHDSEFMVTIGPFSRA